MLLKLGSKGKNVKKYKDILFLLGYLYASTRDYFGSDTQKAVKNFQKKNKDKNGKALVVDGIIGDKTAWALDTAYSVYLEKNEELEVPKSQYYGTQGQTVKDWQTKLNSLGITDANGKKLAVDGIWGSKTESAYQKFLKMNIQNVINKDEYPFIDENIIDAINADLQDEDEKVKNFIKEALKWVFPYGLYVYGANLYKPDLSVQIPTPEYIDTRANAAPEYFNGGRKEQLKRWYEEAVSKGQYIGCADCSGFAVGIMRKLAYAKASFDTTAHGMYHSYCNSLKKADLRPADFVFTRNTSGTIPHMGIYIGAGYTIEAAGAAYGVQLSSLDRHVIVDQMTKKSVTRTAWTVYGRCKYIL